jgi:o-succinylbenzoate synthase
MKINFFRRSLPLTVPYNLSFTILNEFDLFYVIAEQDGKSGYGEITPLPGYGYESCKSVSTKLLEIAGLIEAGEDDPWNIISRISDEYPFLASGVACALETLVEGVDAAWHTPVGQKIPLAGLCAGTTPKTAAHNARALVDQGFRTLKLKIGGKAGIAADLARVRGVCSVIPAATVLRLDANQSLAEDAAIALCAGLTGLPIELVEQPYDIDCWEETARLVTRTTVPIMLDEAISTEQDIHRAKETGAQWIKLKLCKHPGMAATSDLVTIAQSIGLKLVFGNGVQSAMGNHLESRIFVDSNISAAGEQNGFLKVLDAGLDQQIYINNGDLIDKGLHKPISLISPGQKSIAEWHFAQER